LDRKVERLEAQRQRLQSGAELIAATLAGDSAGAELPEAMLTRMDELGRRSDAARPRLRRALDEIVTEAQRASTYQRQVAEALQSLEDVRLQEERTALRLDAEQPPLWQSPPRLAGLAATAGRNLLAAWEIVVESVRTQAGRWSLLVIALAGSIAGMLALRRAASDDHGDARNTLVLQKPVAAAVLIWSVIAPELLGLEFTAGHGLLHIVIVVAAAWPLLRLIAPAAVQVPLRGLLVLSIVSTWLTALLNTKDASLGFLVLGVVGLALFARLRRATAAAPAAGAGGIAVIVRLGIHAGIVILGAGVIALLTGALELGEQLVEGMLLSTLVPAVLLVAAQTLRELWDQAIEHAPAQHLRAIRNHPDLVRRRGHQLINLALVMLALPMMPRLFPFTALAWESLSEALQARLEIGGISISAIDVIVLLLGIALAIGLARLVRFLLDEEVMTRLPVAPGAASAASRLIYYLLLTVGLLMALAASGFELGQLTLVVSALGVGLGFGLQNVVSNFVSGIVLAFERPFNVGDLIAVGDQTGRVLSIGLRATSVRTLEGAEVIVPNSTFIAGNVINWTLSDRTRRIDLPLGVAYGSDLRKVQSLIREVIDGIPDLARHPEPLVAFTGFGESSLDFRVLVWTPDADRLLVTTSELAMAINDALEKAGIEIPFPQRDIHIRTQAGGSPEHAGEQRHAFQRPGAGV
ncbi:MAG: mechanosensitive ion channel, partial [Gammaproteobacteria bacterium]|nr:mechanosensitive ion channel [Gammaproteobacteria bacterium]